MQNYTPNKYDYIHARDGFYETFCYLISHICYFFIQSAILMAIWNHVVSDILEHVFVGSQINSVSYSEMMIIYIFIYNLTVVYYMNENIKLFIVLERNIINNLRANGERTVARTTTPTPAIAYIV